MTAENDKCFRIVAEMPNSHDFELKNVLSNVPYLLTFRFFMFFLYTLTYDESERS